jgi:hypothetical protein
MSALLHETPEERRKRLFFESAPPDPTAQAKKAGRAHFNRSLHDVLMPQSVMPIGPHTGKLMERVPHDYLAWVQAQPWAAHWHPWHPVADYLDRFPLPESQGPQWPSHICTVTAMQACAPTQEWNYPEHALLRCHHDIYLHEDKYHTFALGALGLRPQWFDPKIQAYRLTFPKRLLAIQLGAGELAADPRQRDRPNYQRTASDGTPLCTKAHYATKEQADLVAAQRIESRRNAPAFLRSYHCPECGLHHLTSKPL